MADETAPLALALDATGDIEITTDTASGGLRLASGLEAVTSQINSAMLLWKGTLAFDTEEGVDYIDLLGEKKSERELTTALRNQIFKVEHVVEIQTISTTFNRQGRVLSVYFEILTEFGVVSGTVEI